MEIKNRVMKRWRGDGGWVGCILLNLSIMYKDPLLPGNIYHIYNRGNNKEWIFKEHKNYRYFLELWKKHINPVADSYVYSLQPNHFHFLIKTKEEMDLSNGLCKKINQSFSNFFNAYSKSINKAYNRVGSLFQERFGRKLISSEDYFTQIIWYIHSNAEKHGIVKDFRNYPYCSYQAILSNKPSLLLRDEVLAWFGSKEAYIKFHNESQTFSSEYLKNIEF